MIGLAPAHVAFKDNGGITAVDFNVGKSDRSVNKVTGKRKKVLMCVCRRMYLKKFLFLSINFVNQLLVCFPMIGS